MRMKWVIALLGLILLLLVITISFAECYNGMVGYWAFDDGNGTTAIDSADGNDGTVESATWTDGVIGGALDFDGATSDVSLPNLGFSGNVPFTVSFWMNRTTSGVLQEPFSFGDFEITMNWYDNQPNLEVASNGYDGPRISTPLPAAEERHNVVMVSDTNQILIYYDGVLQPTNYGLPPYQLSVFDNYYYVGCSGPQGCTLRYQGKIDEVVMYNVALNPIEVQQQYYNAITYDTGYCSFLNFPNVSISQPTASTYNVTELPLEYTATSGSGIDSCWYSLNGDANVSLPGCANTTITGTEGSNTIVVYANDTSGYIDYGSVSFDINTSTAPPLVIGFVPPTPDVAGIIHNTSIILNVSANQVLPYDCYFSLNGTWLSINKNMTIDGSSAYYVLNTLPYDYYTYVAGCYDGSGYVYTETRTLTIEQLSGIQSPQPIQSNSTTVQNSIDVTTPYIPLSYLLGLSSILVALYFILHYAMLKPGE